MLLTLCALLPALTCKISLPAVLSTLMRSVWLWLCLKWCWCSWTPMLLYVLGVSSQRVLTQTPSVQTDRSKTVTMDCNIAKNEGNSVHWYKQIPQSAPQFVLKQSSGGSPDKYGDSFSSSRFTAKTSSSIDYQLIISNVEAGDSAVYYCYTLDDSTSSYVSQWWRSLQKPPHCSHSLLHLIQHISLLEQESWVNSCSSLQQDVWRNPRITEMWNSQRLEWDV